MLVVGIIQMLNAQEIAQRYATVYQDCSEEDMIQGIDRYPNNIISDDHLVMMYVRLTTETFSELLGNPQLLMDKDFLIQCYSEDGDNIHILKGFGKASSLRRLRKQLIARSPRTISFYRDDLDKLHVLYGRV